MYKIADWIDSSKLDVDTIIYNNKHEFINEIILLCVDEISTIITLNDIDESLKNILHSLHAYINYDFLLKKNNNRIANHAIKKFDGHNYFDNFSSYYSKLLHVNSSDTVINFLKKNPKNINWYSLSSNDNPRIIELYEYVDGLIKNETHVKLVEMDEYNPKDNCPYIREHVNMQINEKYNIDKSYNNHTGTYFNNFVLHISELSKNNNNKIVDYILENGNEEQLLNNEKVLNNFCQNENDKIVKLLSKNQDKINWSLFSKNANNKAIKLLQQNMEKINWSLLSSNANNKAIELLQQNMNKIDWIKLSANPCDKAFCLLEQNMDKINWNNFCKNLNPKVIEILKKNNNSIDYESLSYNPNIFVYNYKYMYRNMWKENGIGQGLMEYFNHPLRYKVKHN